jgi:autotransporter-associated beta strand protein
VNAIVGTGSPIIAAGDVINATSLFVGVTRAGRLDVTGGNLTIGTFRIGNIDGDSYVYLSGGNITKTSAGPSCRFGWTDTAGDMGNVGHFVMSDGTFTNNGNFLFGFGQGNTGYLEMTGGKVVSTGVDTAFGYTGTGIGTMSGTAQWEQHGEFVIGRPNDPDYTVGGTGTVTMSGSASIDVVDSQLRIGYDGGRGTLNLGPGNSVHVNQWLQVGNRDNGALLTGTGTVNMTGGTLTKDAVSGTYMLMGRSATGQWNQSGGLADIRTALYLGNNGTSGTLNLNGGTFSIGKIQFGYEADANAVGTINFNGGTLKVNPLSPYLPSAGSAFIDPRISQHASLFVKSGGAILDTSGVDCSIGLPLQEDAASKGGGLTKTGLGKLTLSGGIGYTGVTTVNQGTLEVTNLSTPLSAVYVTVDATLIAGSLMANSLTVGGPMHVAASAPTAVPEPGSMVLLVLAGLALAGAYLRR